VPCFKDTFEKKPRLLQGLDYYCRKCPFWLQCSWKKPEGYHFAVLNTWWLEGTFVPSVDVLLYLLVQTVWRNETRKQERVLSPSAEVGLGCTVARFGATTYCWEAQWPLDYQSAHTAVGTRLDAQFIVFAPNSGMKVSLSFIRFSLSTMLRTCSFFRGSYTFTQKRFGRGRPL